MRSVKKYFWLLLLLAGAAFAVYEYGQSRPCTAPITYKIGTLDPRFKVSESEFKEDIQQASDIWGDAIHKKLFVYDPNGSLTINLIYDTRQQTTQAESVLKNSINQTTVTATTAKEQYKTLQSEYQLANDAYTRQLNSFKQDQESYNASVDFWNNRGGAPPAEFATLQAKKNSLINDQAALDAKRQEVNGLADATNALIDKYNLLVDHINANVRTINNDGLAGTQFEEGVYTQDEAGRRIDIFQFDTKTAFIRVIAHELGHALNLAHNDSMESIMNPINEGTALSVSSEDLQELQAECGLN